jgi:hypothetical protein
VLGSELFSVEVEALQKPKAVSSTENSEEPNKPRLRAFYRRTSTGEPKNMKRQRWIRWMAAGLVTLSAAGWLCAQEAERPPRPPQGEGREGGPGFGRGQQQFRPMMGMGMQASMAATADYVFILRGNTLYKYDVKTLKMEGKAELEMPMPPRGPQEGEGGRRPPQEGGERRPPPQQ